MSVWLLILLAPVAAFALLLVLAWSAPDGWEDEQGFHLGLAESDPRGKGNGPDARHGEP